jgi:hypothetical protein
MKCAVISKLSEDTWLIIDGSIPDKYHAFPTTTACLQVWNMWNGKFFPTYTICNITFSMFSIYNTKLNTKLIAIKYWMILEFLPVMYESWLDFCLNVEGLKAIKNYKDTRQ